VLTDLKVLVFPDFIGVLGRRFLYMYEVFGWTREEGKQLIDAYS